MPSSAPFSSERAPALVVEGLEVRYQREPSAAPTLAIDRMTILPGEHVGLTGPSGSGKTTLLHAMAGIERPDAGNVRWGNVDLTALDDAACACWRRLNVGMVFQDFQLVRALSALDNVLLPWRFDHFTVTAAVKNRATALMEAVGVAENRRVAVLSRGEQQRVAVARALFRSPSVIIADEPTASLDAASGQLIAGMLIERAKEIGATLIVVSHDPALLALLPRVEMLVKGRVMSS